MGRYCNDFAFKRIPGRADEDRRCSSAVGRHRLYDRLCVEVAVCEDAYAFGDLEACFDRCSGYGLYGGRMHGESDGRASA